MPSLDLPAPAKLNLFLHVTGKLPNGYHTLESLFVPIDLTDRISLETRNDNAILRRGDVVGAPENDLCVRAARALATLSGKTSGVEITVEKRIPAGAGLGGGSSDAATTLWGLNRLWNLGLDRAKLMDIGKSLGADVPFFLFGQPALARGIGEILTACPVEETDFDIFVPEARQDTKQVFERLPDSPSGSTALDPGQIARWDMHTLLRQTRNDLEPVVRAINPAVRRMFDGISGLRMTGSGSAAFRPRQDSANIGTARQIPQYVKQISAKSLKMTPLFSVIPN